LWVGVGLSGESSESSRVESSESIQSAESEFRHGRTTLAAAERRAQSEPSERREKRRAEDVT
jgi:hypothetical protein